MKTLQFVRTPAGWRISAVAWDDERDGLRLEPGYAEPADAQPAGERPPESGAI